MTLGIAVLLFVLAVGGVIVSALCLKTKKTLRTICLVVFIAAAILLAGGQKGNRYILEHSKVMIHEPLLANGVGGSATSIKNISESILETRKIVNGILAEHTGKSIEEINEATSFDNYMNAKEAIEFGICDAITKQIKVA